jgi:hypothetical protein
MAHSEASRFQTAVYPSIARARGRSCLKRSHGFTLIEVQVAIVVFVFGMIAVLGYARVNGSLVASVESERGVDGYFDLASERAIVIVTGDPGTTGRPECDVRLEEIDDSGAYPVVEVSTQRALP